MQAAQSSAVPDPRPPAALSAVKAEPADELTRLAAELESRASVVHLARGAVLLFVSAISGGLTYRLFMDSTGLPFYWWAVMAIFAAAVVFGIGQILRGRSLLAEERSRFARYLELRRQAGLDDSTGPCS